MSNTVTFLRPVVGVTFVDDYPHNLLGITKPRPARLVRNPANEFDPNAIEVRTDDGVMIGHLDRGTALMMATAMDQGRVSLSVELQPARVDQAAPNQPGISVLIASTLLEVAG